MPDTPLQDVITTFEVNPGTCQDLLDELEDLYATYASKLPGFVSAALHVNDARMRIAIHSRWETREAFLALLRDGKGWAKLTGTYRITTLARTPYDDVTPFARALIEANEDRVVWGTDWPHPTFNGVMPNDGALLDQLATWAPDPALRQKILVSNAEQLYGFEAVGE